MIIANVFDACVREKLSHRITIISSKKTTNRIPGRLQTNDQIVAHWALCRYVKDNKYFNFLFFKQNSGIEKAFLFDVVSKIYIATDCSPVDMQSYELCCDMIDVVIDLSSIYRYASMHNQHLVIF